MYQTTPYTATRDTYRISTDPALLDVDWVHQSLTNTYWATGIPREVVAKALTHSLAFGMYTEDYQMGIARVISDFATFAYVSDVFIDPAHRNKGLSLWLIECIRAHPELQGLRRMALVTTKARDLYAKCGFTDLSHPERWMEIFDPEIYL
jgi:GNAT superfamily N-acetyltransferase